jgi:hypothetical protein
MVIHLIPHFGIGGDIGVVKSMVRVSQSSGQAVFVNGLSPADAFNDARSNPLPLNEGVAGFRAAWSRRAIIPSDAKVIHAHSPVCLAFALLLRLFRCRTARVVFRVFQI